jgi:hypothetical protein
MQIRTSMMEVGRMISQMVKVHTNIRTVISILEK